MPEDIGSILKNWPYDPQNSIRKVIDPGAWRKSRCVWTKARFKAYCKWNWTADPTARSPTIRPLSWTIKELLQKHVGASGSTAGFNLDEHACSEIFDESRRIYERYVFLLQIRDYSRVVRDTERNMDVFRFVNRYAERGEDRKNLEKWWPYILRIHAVARVMIATQQEDYDTALEIIHDAQTKIANLEGVEAEEFEMEKKRSQDSLRELEDEILSKRPQSPAEKLKEELAQAVEEEDFERAAAIRDKIWELEES